MSPQPANPRTRPTLLQRCFADYRPLYGLMILGAVGMAVFAAAILLPFVRFSARGGLTWFVVMVAVAALLGAVLAFFPGNFLLMAFYAWVERRNGAPFVIGDEVVVLSKRAPGRVACVYEVWAERHELR